MVPSLIAFLMTTSRRGLAAAAPTQLVQPMSRYFFATSAHQRMCSSGGMRWIASSVGWSFHEKWVCASTIPGIRKAPAPSTTRAPPTGAARTPLALRTTRAILSPWTSTSPMNGASPPPSKMRTLV